MASNGFVFPPPPPPPPVSSSQNFSGPSYPSQNTQWNPRGRGGPRGGSSGRGGGESNSRGYGSSRGNRGGQQSGYSYQQRNGFREQPNQTSGRNIQSHGQTNQWQPSILQNTSSSIITSNYRDTSFDPRAGNVAGQKRQFGQAFSPSNTVPVKMQAAPSVPSFGLTLPSPLEQKPVTTAIPSIKKTRNLFGLSPDGEEHEVSDEDEEAKLAASVNNNSSASALSFTYRGKSATLQTAEDIAAWIAERRKNFPSAARREEMAQKKAEEREKAMAAKQAAQKKVQEAKQARQKENGVKGKRNGGDKPTAPVSLERPQKLSKGNTSTSKEQAKIEKLRKAMERNAKKLAKLEAAANQAKNVSEDQPVESLDKEVDASRDGKDFQELDEDSLTVSTSSDSEATSSSGSSGSSSEDDDDYDSDASSDLETRDIDTNTVATIPANINSENLINSHDSDSEAPETLSTARKIPIRVPPPPRGKEDKRPLCRNLEKYGKCTRRFCKFQHRTKDDESKGQASRRPTETKSAEKLTLYQRLLKQQIEEDELEEQKKANLAAAEADTTVPLE